MEIVNLLGKFSSPILEAPFNTKQDITVYVSKKEEISKDINTNIVSAVIYKDDLDHFLHDQNSIEVFI